MTAVLDELGLTGLVTSMTGLSADRRGGDPGRDRRPEAVRHRPRVVKHAGLAPREKLSGTFTGRTRLTGQGRPGLRLAAWRAVWGAQRANPVYARPLPAPDQQGAEQAHPHPGADRHRRRDLAAAARHHHHRTGLGSGHRGPRRPAAKHATRRLILSAALKLAAGASPPRH